MKHLLFTIFGISTSLISAQMMVLNTSLTAPEKHILYTNQVNTLQITGFDNHSNFSLVSSGGDTIYPADDSLFHIYPDFPGKYDSLKIYSSNKYLQTLVFKIEALGGVKFRLGDFDYTLTETEAILVNKQDLLDNPRLIPTYEPQLFKATWHIIETQATLVKKDETQISLYTKTNSPGKFSEEDLEVIRKMEPGETIWYGYVLATCADCKVNRFPLGLRLILTENKTPTATVSLQNVFNTSLASPEEHMVYRKYNNVLYVKGLTQDSSTVIISSDGGKFHLKNQEFIYSPSTKGAFDSLIIFHNQKYINTLVFKVEDLGTPTTYFGRIHRDTTISMQELLDNPGFSCRYNGVKLKNSDLTILEYSISLIKSTGEEIHLKKNTFKNSDSWSDKRIKRYNLKRLKRGMDLIVFSRKQLRQIKAGDIILFDPMEAKIQGFLTGQSYDPESLILRIK